MSLARLDVWLECVPEPPLVTLLRVQRPLVKLDRVVKQRLLEPLLWGLHQRVADPDAR